MTRHEYNALQWLIPATRGNWQQQVCDVKNRQLTKNLVRNRTKADWSNSPNADDVIKMPRKWKQGENDRGRAMQKGHPTKRIKFKINNTYKNKQYDVKVPAPARGDGYWIEGNPRPLALMALNDSLYDCHIIMVLDEPDDEGWEVYELIGVSHWFGQWRALGCARWDTLGNLCAEDTPVTWGGEQMSRLIYNIDDKPHCLSLTLKGRDEDPETFPWRGQWLSLNPEAVPAALNSDEKKLADILVNYGCIVQDHGGQTRLSVADGAQWNKSDFQWLEQCIKLSDFMIAS